MRVRFLLPLTNLYNIYLMHFFHCSSKIQLANHLFDFVGIEGVEPTCDQLRFRQCIRLSRYIPILIAFRKFSSNLLNFPSLRRILNKSFETIYLILQLYTPFEHLKSAHRPFVYIRINEVKYLINFVVWEGLEPTTLTV